MLTSRRVRRILPLLAVLLSAGRLRAAPTAPPPAPPAVRASDSGWTHRPWWGDDPYKGEDLSERQIDFLTAGVNYSLGYFGVTGPKLGDKAWFVGLRLGGPYAENRSPNWYGNGFQSLEIDGQAVTERKLAGFTLLDTGRQGLMEMVWDLPTYRVRLRYLVPPEGKYFLEQWLLEPAPGAAPLKSLRLRLSCFPGEFTTASIAGPGDRIITTAQRDYPQGSHPDLDPAQEWWVLYADKVMDRAKQVVLPKTGRFVKGCGGLDYLPVPGMKVHLDITDYEVATYLDYPPDTRDLRLAFWEMPTKTNAEALEMMRSSAAEVRARLEQTTFLPTVLLDLNHAREKEALADLAAQTHQPVTPVEKTLDELGVLVAQLKAGQGEAGAQPITAEERALALADDYTWEKARLQRLARPGLRVLDLQGLFHYAGGVEAALALLGPQVEQVQVGTIHSNERQTTSLSYVPGTAEEMGQYNVVILDDVDPLALGGTGQTLLRALLRHGGGLLITGGFYSYGNAHVRGTDLEPFWPVVIKGPFDLLPVTPPAGLAAAGKSPLTAGLSWDKPPVVLWRQALEPVPGARVVVTAGGKAFLVTNALPTGRVAAVLGSPLGIAPGGSLAYWEWKDWPTLLARTIKWLGKGENK
jgi:uncharacterized membrane protein